MAVWVVRGGSDGEHEETFMSEGIAAIGFGMAKSIGNFDKIDDLKEYAAKPSDAYQLWRFARNIPNGDMVVLPRKLTNPRVVVVGRVSGDYEFRPSLAAPHICPVEWIAQIPLSDFDEDFQSSFTGDLTFFTVQKAKNAESRIERMISEHTYKSPNDDDADSPDIVVLSRETGDDAPVRVDFGGLIADRIRQRFSGGRLAYLVASILRASGYHAVETGQGSDGGVDVVAGTGDLGFGRPRLAVQVKSGPSPADIDDYKQLQGRIGNYGADHGLLVSLVGFTPEVRNENVRSFFQIRLWGPNELVDKLLAIYDALPEDIRREILLKCRGILVETEF